MLNKPDTINFNSMFYLIQYIQNIIISSCNKYKKLMRYLNFFLVLHLQNLMCILHLYNILSRTGHISSAP